MIEPSYLVLLVVIGAALLVLIPLLIVTAPLLLSFFAALLFRLGIEMRNKREEQKLKSSSKKD